MTSEFARRMGFTLGALLIYRLGCNIPLPGIKIDLLEQLFRAAKPVGLLSLLMPPNGIHRLAIFALGIIPYITAAVFLQVAGIVIRPIRTLRMRGVDGRRIERRITLCITVALAAFQAYGVALALEGTRGAIEDPGALFLISTVVGLAGLSAAGIADVAYLNLRERAGELAALMASGWSRRQVGRLLATGSW